LLALQAYDVSMTEQGAQELILFEGGSGEDKALFVAVRMGDDPGPERMRRLLTALQIVGDALKGQDLINRELAAALWVLGSTVVSNYEAGERNGIRWREGFFEEIVELMNEVEGIFIGEPVQPRSGNLARGR
jgi:hypothetical protein